MRIEWDARAVRDLPAAGVAEQIKTSIERLNEFPLMGRRTRHPNIRILPITGMPYVVYYYVLADVVEIVGVFHGARRRFSD
jgi:plasmid stabilization system protein ParE